MTVIPLCGYHWLTGHPCPLCGLTRAMVAIAAGHWADALRLNALTPLALLMVAVLFHAGAVRQRVWQGGVVLFAAYGVCRVFFPGL